MILFIMMIEKWNQIKNKPFFSLSQKISTFATSNRKWNEMKSNQMKRKEENNEQVHSM